MLLDSAIIADRTIHRVPERLCSCPHKGGSSIHRRVQAETPASAVVLSDVRLTSLRQRAVPVLDWVVQLAAVSTGAEASVLVSDEPPGPQVVASFGAARREAHGWLPVTERWLIIEDARSHPDAHLIQTGPFPLGFAAAAPLNRPSEGIRASLWVISRHARRSGLTAWERECLGLLTEMAFEPLLLHYANSGWNPSPSFGKVTVLIGDDDEAFRQTARQEFDTGGFAVLEAHTGRQVLRRMAEESPDILVIDLAMPDGEGIETIQTLRAEGYSGVIVAMSGAFSENLLRTARLLGATGCLVKPFRKGELSALVAKLLIDRWGTPPAQ